MTLLDFSCPPCRSCFWEMEWVKQCLSLFAHAVISAVHWRSSCVCVQHAVCVLCHFQGRFNATAKFANQLFCSSAHQTGLSSSIAPPCPPCSSACPAKAHQADRGTVCLTLPAFQSFSSVSQPTKQNVSQADRALRSPNHHAKSAGIMRGNGPLVGN